MTPRLLPPLPDDPEAPTRSPESLLLTRYRRRLEATYIVLLVGILLFAAGVVYYARQGLVVASDIRADLHAARTAARNSAEVQARLDSVTRAVTASRDTLLHAGRDRSTAAALEARTRYVSVKHDLRRLDVKADSIARALPPSHVRKRP